MKCPNCGYKHKTQSEKYIEAITAQIINEFPLNSESFDWMTATTIAHSLGYKKTNLKLLRAIAASFHAIYKNDNQYFKRKNNGKFIKVYK